MALTGDTKGRKVLEVTCSSLILYPPSTLSSPEDGDLIMLRFGLTKPMEELAMSASRAFLPLRRRWNQYLGERGEKREGKGGEGKFLKTTDHVKKYSGLCLIQPPLERV